MLDLNEQLFQSIDTWLVDLLPLLHLCRRFPLQFSLNQKLVIKKEMVISIKKEKLGKKKNDFIYLCKVPYLAIEEIQSSH